MTAATTHPGIIQISPRDNVAIVTNDLGLAEGTLVSDSVRLREHVPQAHKVSLEAIAARGAIIRYNVTIGYALEDIPAGSWVHEGLLDLPTARGLDDLPIATRNEATTATISEHTFEGFRNRDGSVGTRNLLGITTTVQCVSGVVDYAVRRIRDEMLPKYPNVDGVVSLEHTYGCGVAIDAPGAEIPIRTLRNISLNPNFGGELMVVSLGCEKLQPTRLLPSEADPVVKQFDLAEVRGRRAPVPDIVRLQDEKHTGFMSMIDSIMTVAEQHLQRLNERKRVTCPVADLVVGVQCGGSDAFSGITANPAVGVASDLVVRSGGTVMFSEVTEVRDAIDQLTSRAVDATVADAMIREMAWYDAYLARGQADRSANTTPGNKKGGLSNIVEKAMGSIIKSGTAPISGVLSPGERLDGKRGLIFAATPASDFICGTLQLAAGMNIHIFTTGRGTPYGLAAVPVVKVATRSELAKRWHDLMDFDAGPIATGDATVEDVGRQLFDYMLDVASGRKKTWAEHWQLHNALALFNPAPVT
jgi:galactarate dehydratase